MTRKRLVEIARERDRRNGEGKPLPADAYPDDRRGDAWEPPADPEPQPEPPALDEVDAAELAVSGEALHLEYLPLLGQDGYLVRGWSHLIAGYPRVGKTELLAASCRDWLAAGERIVYFTEEPRPIWAHRLARAVDAWQGMRLVFALGANPHTLLERLRAGEETVAVVDTIRGLGVIRGDECDNAALAGQLTPWVAAARQTGKTLVLSHHMRKGAGEHGEGIAGGHAILGTVDIALELSPDHAPGRRLVRARARLIQPAELMYERREDGTMHALGTPECVSLREVRRRVLDVLDDEWLKTADVRDRVDEPKPSLPQLRQALAEEAKAGTVERDPPAAAGPVAGKTVRWRKAPAT